MAIRIVIDSASDILPAEAEKMGIIHVPLIVSFDGEEYRDAVDLTHRQFYEKLIESDTLPKTSQVPPSVFSGVFREIVEAGDTVIAVTLSSVLSGTYQSACIAAEDFPDRVFVVDSESVSLGQRLLVLRAMQMACQGMEAEKIVECLNAEKKSVCVLAVLDTLEYLKKGGRISAATAFAGNLLSVKPVITLKDGAIVMLGKARGSKNSGNLLRKLISEGRGVDYDKDYCVAYSGITDAFLQKYIADNEDLWKPRGKELTVTTVGCVIGTHVGPGAIAVAFFEKA